MKHEAVLSDACDAFVRGSRRFLVREEVIKRDHANADAIELCFAEVGYAGGTTANPNYEQVKTGSTGHAESVRILYDPSKLAFADLLEKWFFKMHDPTTANRQGNDVGTHYRSAIFNTTPDQKKIAEEVKAKVEASGKWKKPIITQIVAAGPFTKAEDYRQDYLQKHPGGYSCHFMRD